MAQLPWGFTLGGPETLRWTDYEGDWSPFVLGGGSRRDLVRSIRLNVRPGRPASSPVDCASSPIPLCSWWTRSATYRSPRTAPCSSSSSSTHVTSAPPPCSPPTRASRNGEACSTTRSWPQPSSTGCCTTATSSTSAATATGCESTRTSCGPRPNNATTKRCCHGRVSPGAPGGGSGLRSLRFLRPPPFAPPERTEERHTRTGILLGSVQVG